MREADLKCLLLPGFSWDPCLSGTCTVHGLPLEHCGCANTTWNDHYAIQIHVDYELSRDRGLLEWLLYLLSPSQPESQYNTTNINSNLILFYIFYDINVLYTNPISSKMNDKTSENSISPNGDSQVRQRLPKLRLMGCYTCFHNKILYL